MKKLMKAIGIVGCLSLFYLNNCFATTGIVNTAAARVREKADASSEILTVIYEDDKIEIIEETGNWYKVTANGETGYVSKPLIKVMADNSNNSSNNTSSNSSANNAENTSTNENISANNSETATTLSNDSNISNSDVPLSGTEVILQKDTSLKVMPNFSSNELKVLIKDTKIVIETELGKWIKISTEDGISGWILNNTNTDIVSNTTSSTNSTLENNTSANTNANTATNTNTSVSSNTNENTSNNTSVGTNQTTNTSTDTNTTLNTNTNNTSTGNASTSVKKVKGVVIVETANVREKPSKSSKIIDNLDEDDIITIVEEEGDWYKITCSKVPSGYVSKALIKVQF